MVVFWICVGSFFYTAGQCVAHVFSESLPALAAGKTERIPALPASVTLDDSMTSVQRREIAIQLGSVVGIMEAFPVNIRRFDNSGTMPAYTDLNTDTVYLSPGISTGQLEHILLHEIGHLVDKNVMNVVSRAQYCTISSLDCSLWGQETYSYTVSSENRSRHLSSPAEAFAEGFARYIENRSSSTSPLRAGDREQDFFADLHLAD
ncbi:hypothetical protein AUK40_02210 [Candidatus Wirthbacteria bacterium CG2_30_54_11]|uniref:Uncharacterized protein n=1 Tax=Candidatus Wirthbacteria bacterium CG2_30_54_11 TaxID=1817892 RepID=A0A1J5IMM0_9BACT|nr:MAG: hypothetical protein AUK40_02210 [Candidatus Wirthbacteria bacterium CG2_30_54_11]